MVLFNYAAQSIRTLSARSQVRATNIISYGSNVSLYTSSQRNSHTISTTIAALDLLSLTNKPNFTSLELRDAYFSAAKRCHPDSRFQRQQENNNTDVYDLTSRFMLLADAYEYLQKKRRNSMHNGDKSSSSYGWNNVDEDDVKISENEEEEFRAACIEYLGLQAEVVEESKRCPLFRDWLRGNTDAALHWKLFFMLNGGLAPKLNPVSNLLDGGVTAKKMNRRMQHQRRSV